MRMLLNFVTYDSSKDVFHKKTNVLDGIISIDSDGYFAIEDNNFDLNEIDYIIVDDESYSNTLGKDIKSIYKSIYDVLKETAKKNGMLNITLETREHKKMKYETLTIYSY